MINPARLLKIKKSWDTFSSNHPKFVMFLKAVSNKAGKEGTIIEIKVTTSEGETLTSNMRVTKSDEDMFDELSDMFKTF